VADKNTDQTPEGKALRELGQKWLDRIKASEKLEDTWLKDADEAVKVYTNEGASSDDTVSVYESDFNILFSNVETIVPAIINSPPAPDIRRRFGDADPVAKEFSEIVERAIIVQVDDSQLQIELEAVAQDAFLAGRGVVRLRFKADIEGEPELDEINELAMDEQGESGHASQGKSEEYGLSTEAINGEASTGVGVESDDTTLRDEYTENNEGDAEPALAERGSGTETVTNERITFEAVSWRDYRHGPAKRWEDRPWDAFRHSMPQEEVNTFKDVPMVTGQMTSEDRAQVGESDDDLVIWEVWCKKTKKVKFINDADGVILKMIDDPLELTRFFPIAKPVQPIEVTGRLMPINPYAIYRRLALQLDKTTKRIDILLNAMKVKGWYAGDATDLESVMTLDDNEFAPITNSEQWAMHGGIEKAIAFWPIEIFAKALRELYVARDQTKQAIYEITGISDIVRGASKATETLGAQEIKTQWGNLRIQKAQRAMERCARELFVMMSEIIPDKFTPETLQKMTSIQMVPNEQDLIPVQPRMQEDTQPEQAAQAQQQAQQQEQARQQKLQKMKALNQMMHDKVTAYYRVDVETDSTVRADLTRQKKEVAEFLAASGAYFKAVGPLVADGTLPANVAIEIYASNARMFNLGKATEDAIDEMVSLAEKKSKQPKQEQPNPDVIKAQADAKAQDQQMQIDAGKAKIDERAAQVDFDSKSQDMQAKMALEIEKNRGASQKNQADAIIAVMDKEIKQIEFDIKQTDLQIKQADLAIKVAIPEPAPPNGLVAA